MIKSTSALTFGLLIAGLPAFAADMPAPPDDVVNQTIRPLMQEYAIPGMAVAISRDGKALLLQLWPGVERGCDTGHPKNAV